MANGKNSEQGNTERIQRLEGIVLEMLDHFRKSTASPISPEDATALSEQITGTATPEVTTTDASA